MNTKNLPKGKRKYAKRRARGENKKLYAKLSPKDRSEYGRSEKSFKAFAKEKGLV